MPKIAVDEHELLASICRQDFYTFFQEFWPVLIEEVPVWNWHIHYLCRQAQIIAERVFQGLPRSYDLLVNVPPGTTKSTIFSIMFPAWVWTRMPSARFITASHTQDLVLDLSRKSRFIIESPKYKKCFPEIQLQDDANTKGLFVNSRGGMRLSATVGGKMPTGFHGHFLITDDPIDPAKALSEAELKTANAFQRESLHPRRINKAMAVMMVIMQRLRQHDPSGDWLERAADRIKHICLPAELSEHIRPPHLASRYKEGLLDPIRLSSEVLDEERKIGEFYYAGQFMQHPIPIGGAMFKVDRIIVEDHAPDDLQTVVRYWDNAATEGDGTYTVGVKMGIRRVHGLPEFWILDVARFRERAEIRENRKVSIAAIDGREVEIGQEQEPGSSGKESAEATARRLAGFRVRIDRPTGDKIMRADEFSVQVNAGSVHMLNREWSHEYMQELAYFPSSRFKDQVDASSGAFAMLAAPAVAIGAF